jgi:hypothetical protein
LFSSKLFANIPSDRRRSDVAEKVICITTGLIKEQIEQNKEQPQNDIEGEITFVDSDDDYDGRDGCKNDETVDVELPDMYKSFIMALPECPMILGFHSVMTDATADACCYCPCSEKLAPWREKFNLYGVPICGSKNSTPKFTPNGLVAHLEQKKDVKLSDDRSSFFHCIVYQYIKTLYSNYWGSNVHHKALYKVASADYKKAEAKEKNYELAYVMELDQLFVLYQW